jgi:hypothetical protein
MRFQLCVHHRHLYPWLHLQPSTSQAGQGSRRDRHSAQTGHIDAFDSPQSPDRFLQVADAHQTGHPQGAFAATASEHQ